MSLISYPCADANHEAVRQIVDQFVSLYPGSDYGPAHIALADYNLLNEHLRFCRTELLAYRTGTSSYRYNYEHSINELDATEHLLELLRLMPEEWRDIHSEAVE